MDDLKDIQSESSFKSFDSDENEVPGLDKTVLSPSAWGHLDSDYEGSESKAVKATALLEDGEDEDENDFELPEGFGEIPGSEQFLNIPSAQEERYQGPSTDSSDQIFNQYEAVGVVTKPVVNEEATRPIPSASQNSDDKTVSIQQDLNLNVTSVTASVPTGHDVDKTVAVDGFANAGLGKRKSSEVDVKVSVGNYRGARGAANVMTSVDASLAQSENLKLAQQRILELEKEVENLRSENEELASAGEIIRSRTDNLSIRISSLEREKEEILETSQSELLILKGNLQYKETEVGKARIKIEELESRLKSDFKKIRVRERELENRLELLRAEKTALSRSKDEYILEQKRKIDHLTHELDNYRQKCLELNKTIEANQDQVKRTERALRLALSNLEAKEENLVPLKKAE